MSSTSVSGIGTEECGFVSNYTDLSDSHYVGNAGWVSVTSIVSLSKYSLILPATLRRPIPHSPVSQQALYRINQMGSLAQ